MINLSDGNVGFICLLHGKLAKHGKPTHVKEPAHAALKKEKAKSQSPINPSVSRLQTVLFLCTHNSARSQMAEAFLNHLCGDKFRAESAGISPTGINAYVKRAMAEIGIDLSTQRSKRILEFQGKTFDYVVTVCDQARETCPFFPGEKQIHKPFPDPSAFSGAEEEILAKVRAVRDEIKGWIDDVFCKGNPDAETGLQSMRDLLK
jgi:arsenate reductase